MMSSRTIRLDELAAYVIRPILAEARLMSKKHACDAVYVTTLANELRGIEAKISAVEKDLELSSKGDLLRPEISCAVPEPPSAEWIRNKSAELEARLHRVEQSSTAKSWQAGAAPKRQSSVNRVFNRQLATEKPHGVNRS
jgi:hypothetical protein